MTEASASVALDGMSYAYKPSLLGAGWSFRLTSEGLAWGAGRNSGCVPYRHIHRIRMSFKPVSMQSQRYMTEIWAEGAPRLAIVSSSWKSLMEQERLDKAYSSFVAELHRRVADAQTDVRLERGNHPLIFWPGAIAFAGIGLGLAWLIVRALQSDARGGAAFVALFLILFLWQGGNFFRRNKPGRYRADALPDELMPKG